MTPDDFRRIEGEYQRALTERARVLREAHKAGQSYRALAEVWGLTFTRVAQIVRG